MIKNKKLFVTSNTFFGRIHALDFPNRKKYNDIHSMNNDIVSTWNSVVSDDDIVYHLGYFAHDTITTSEFLERLNGQIVFLNNKFDKLIMDVMHIYANISMFDSPIAELTEKNVLLSYYPLCAWENYDTINLYGYDGLDTDLNLRPNKMCIAYDVWKKPVLVDDIIDMIKSYNYLSALSDKTFELLIDLPGIKKGELYTRLNNYYFCKKCAGTFLAKLDVDTVENNSTWFKQIT